MGKKSGHKATKKFAKSGQLKKTIQARHKHAKVKKRIDRKRATQNSRDNKPTANGAAEGDDEDDDDEGDEGDEGEENEGRKGSTKAEKAKAKKHVFTLFLHTVNLLLLINLDSLECQSMIS
jgi:nucleolar complex protein 2